VKPVSGWVCPKCGAVYAPWVRECPKCRPRLIPLGIFGRKTLARPRRPIEVDE